MSDLVALDPATPARRPRVSETPSTPLVGVGFKHDHWAAVSSDAGYRGFFEVHAENYMGAGGMPHHILESVRRDHPLSLHGVGMSIGGNQPLDPAHLRRFQALVRRYEPFLVSEHLAWSTHGPSFYNDLLPLPYTRSTLSCVCDHVEQVQDAIGRPLLLENPATYVVFTHSTLSEAQFIREVARRTGCHLLLDLNNVFVSATNHRYSTAEYLGSFPLEHVREIHLAGHAERQDGDGRPLLIDSHDAPVAPGVWSLLDQVSSRQCNAPVLIEWDSQLPSWPVLRGEADLASERLRSRGAHAVEVPNDGR